MIHAFEGMTKEQIDQFFKENLFIAWRQLPGGEWIALFPLMFTLSVCMDVTYSSPYAYRWCFEDPAEAWYFFENATEYDEVPTKRESLRGHRYRTTPKLLEFDERGFARW